MSATQNLLRPGDILGGFEVEDLIGIGGMATVYRARQVSLGRPVALKILSREFTGDEVFRERFRREGMHAASLEHPNIVPVYDSGEQDGFLYLAMRLVEGPSLAELLSTRGVTADRAIEIMRPVASALDCAHAAGLIHRDIKPQNILITNQGHPYLADFGVAKDANAPGLTVTGGFVGSINYASPEQIKGLTSTAASDIYALTAVLYHCLSGDVPYPGKSEAGVMHAHLHQPPPTLPVLEGADSEFHTVFARGMAKDPGARYSHAGDLLNAAAICVSRMPTAKRKAIPAFPRGARQEEPGDDAAKPARSDGQPAASLTAVDQRREPPPLEEPLEQSPKRRLRMPNAPKLPSRPKLPNAPKLPSRPKLPARSDALRRSRIAAAVALGAAVLVVAISMIASSGGGSAAANSVRKGPVELSYGEPWGLASEAKGSFYGLRFHGPIMLRGAGATLLAGMLAGGAPVPGGEPPALASRLAGEPVRKTLRLGALPAVRYASTVSGGAALTMYVVPTDVGDVGLLCKEGSNASRGSCAEVAGTLRVHGPNPVGIGADPTLAAGLHSALKPAAAARGKSSALMVSQPAPRANTARAARGISTADYRAAKGLAGLRPEPRDRAAVEALTTALRQEARTLNAAAVAARKRSYFSYNHAAKSARAAGRAIAGAATTLRRMGFGSVPRLRPFGIAPLVRPKPRVAANSVSETSVSSAPPISSAPEPERAPAPAPVTPSPSPSHAVVSAPK